MADIETRIEHLLDQLEQPGLSHAEVEQLERKIRFLKNLSR